jgi:hypothetical protein
MFKASFRRAINLYLNNTSSRGASRAKAKITKVVNDSAEVNTLEQVHEVLAEFNELPEWIKNRFTRGSLYKEGTSMFGWYRENQVQAEVLPVTTIFDSFNREEGYLRVVASRDGFEVPVDMPLAGGSCVVSVPYEQSFFFAKYGWANAWPLQWYRDEEKYEVDRSIIPYGFWRAWKWWEGAWHWYLRNRPELFEDFECWGEPEQRLQAPKSDDVVLGGKKENKEFWEAQKFYIE